MSKHDGSDGSQYDKTFVWDRSAMLERLSDILDQKDNAETPEQKASLRESAIQLNKELYELHGEDLGPFDD